MVKTYRAVGCGCRAEILEIGTGIIIQLVAYPPIKSHDVRYVLHDLHTDSRAKKLRLGLLRGLHLYNPGCFSSLIGEKSKVRNVSHDRTHNVDDSRVSVTSCAKHRVCVNDRA